MKKLIAALMLVAAGAMVYGEEQTGPATTGISGGASVHVQLEASVGPVGEFGFSTEKISSASEFEAKKEGGKFVQAGSGVAIDDFSENGLYVAYETNQKRNGDGFKMQLKASPFVNSTNSNEKVAYSLAMENGAELAANATDSVVVLTDDAGENSGLRAKSAQIGFKNAPDFTNAEAGLYVASLTLEIAGL